MIASSPFGLAAFSKVIPEAMISEALAEMGRETQRQRKLPAELTFWLVVAMGLHRDLSVRNVLRLLQEELGSRVPWGPAETPHSTSASAACDRLGWETLRLIFRRVSAHLTTQHAEADTWRGLFVQAIDGTSFKVPDSLANEAAFGRPGSSRGGKSGYPQKRAVVLMGVWTHLISDVTLGPWSVGENTLAEYLLERMRPNSLVLMDRGYYSFAWLDDVRAQGVNFLVRAKTGRNSLKFRKTRKLGKGHWRGELICPAYLKRVRKDLPDTIPVRIVTYTKKGYGAVTVVTNLLDKNAYPAEELGELYHMRWEIELGFRELKTAINKAPVHLRTRAPERVLQEVYGQFMAYNAVRALMAEAAVEAGESPLRLSFTDCLAQTRFAQWRFAYLPQASFEEERARLIAVLSHCLLPTRRDGRRCPRAVKVKMSKWPRKHPDRAPATTRNRQTRAGRDRVA